VFFDSSRRRHTRCYRDWSSDVCSSDLSNASAFKKKLHRCKPNDEAADVEVVASRTANGTAKSDPQSLERGVRQILADKVTGSHRSEERRVGKEGRGGEGMDSARRTVSR